MIPVTDIATPRFQLAVLVAILFQGLQSVAMPTIISAAEQETPRRHSLIHRSAVESAALPATTQGTMLQPPSAEPTRITSPIGPPKTSVSLPTMPLTHHQNIDQASGHCLDNRSCDLIPDTPCSTDIGHRSRAGHADDSRYHQEHNPHGNGTHHEVDGCASSWSDLDWLCCGRSDRSLSVRRRGRRSPCGLSRKRLSSLV